MKIAVILVSARMPKGIFFLQEELRIKQPIICYSGALVLDWEANILLNMTMPVSDVKQVYAHAKSAGIHMSLYKADEWYIEEMDEWAEQESAITHIIPSTADFHQLFDIWERRNTGPNKILCMSGPKQIQRLEKTIRSGKAAHLNIYPSKPTYLEIMPKTAAKPAAIDYLRHQLNIEKSEIIAIGDNYNDISMLEYAGVGIAMGNAPDEVKRIADDITLSNDEDGVAASIAKYIFS